MTAKTVAQVLEALWVPGTLFVDGQDVGLIADVAIANEQVASEEVAAYEFGLEAVEDHYLGERWGIAFALRNFVQANLDASYPRHAVPNGLEYPNTIQAGTRRSAHARVIRYVPNDVANHPTVEFPSAIVRGSQTFQVNFGYEPETLLAVSFLGLRDPGTGELFKMGIGI